MMTTNAVPGRDGVSHPESACTRVFRDDIEGRNDNGDDATGGPSPNEFCELVMTTLVDVSDRVSRAAMGELLDRTRAHLRSVAITS
jgi:hypothetical protein